MSTITDTFTGPSLDSTKWTAQYYGSADLTVGTPTAGVYPSGINDPGDKVIISSKNKIEIPPNKYVDFYIGYNSLESDSTEDLIHFLGWYSTWEDTNENPLYGTIIAIVKRSGGLSYYYKDVINNGIRIIEPIIEDPNNGANGKLRIVKNGNSTQIYYWDNNQNNWILLDTIILNIQTSAYIVFGQEADDLSSFELEYPWMGELI